MKPEERVKDKEQEIFEIVKNTIAPYFPDPEQLSKEIMDLFCKITPPKEDDSTLGLIIMKQGKLNGARSLKLGNIFLDWKKLLTDGATSILDVYHTSAFPWLIPLVVLVVWNRMWSLLSIKIDERHATVIWAMWKNRDKEDCIENDKVLNLVNKELSKYKRPIMNKKELKSILKDLKKMGCIEGTKENKWWLREEVKITYRR